MTSQKTLLITGAAGFIGSRLLQYFAHDPAPFDRIVAADINEIPAELKARDHIEFQLLDIRDGDAVRACFDQFQPMTCVHLAAIVTPPPGDIGTLQYDVDVVGTRNTIAACVAAGTNQFIYTSSGAAYGYHPDNPVPLSEDDPVRGNEVFPYARHKRIVEEDLARAREEYPDLKQLIFRVSTVLGPATDNQITALFEQPVVTGVAGADAPFCIIADDDVVGAVLHGIHTKQSGIFNLTGDGILRLSQIAERMGGTYVPLPEFVIRTALTAMSKLDIGPYGPEEVLFLKHRPVLDNTRLKKEFGYQPKLSTEQAFERYRRVQQEREDDKNLVVLITGAGGGLGYALAQVHCERGDRLVLVDRDEAALERTYMMARACGQEAIRITADITIADDCERALASATQAFGVVDLVYNNAALAMRALFDDSDDDEFQKIMDVNLMGSVRITRAALEPLKASRGRIAAISSVAGFAPLTGRTAYAASKHAMHGFFETLRSELASDGVSVTMICPSYLDTAFRKDATDGASELDVDQAAHIISEGVLARRRLILVGTTARLSWWVSRLAPSVFEKLMRRSVREEFPG